MAQYRSALLQEGCCSCKLCKKQTTHNRLLTRHSIRYLVSYTPLGFEVSSSFSKKVCTLLSELLESEEASAATLSSTEWLWSATGLPAYFQQALSFEIAKLTALSVQNGIRRAQAAATKGRLAWTLARLSAALNGTQTNSAFASRSSCMIH